jgi:hypothetical protein
LNARELLFRRFTVTDVLEFVGRSGNEALQESYFIFLELWHCV